MRGAADLQHLALRVLNALRDGGLDHDQQMMVLLEMRILLWQRGVADKAARQARVTLMVEGKRGQ